MKAILAEAARQKLTDAIANHDAQSLGLSDNFLNQFLAAASRIKELPDERFSCAMRGFSLMLPAFQSFSRLVLSFLVLHDGHSFAADADLMRACRGPILVDVGRKVS